MMADLRQREIVNAIKSATKLALKRLFEVPLIFWETFKWHQYSVIEKRRIRSYAMELLKRQQQANSIQWECNGYILSFDHRSRHKNTRQSSATIATGGVSAATAKAAIVSMIIPEKLRTWGGG